MNCSTPGFPVPHYLPEFTQVYVHWVSDAIQPSYPLSPSSPALNLSQHHLSHPTHHWYLLSLISGSFPMSWLCIRWPKYWSFSFSISPSSEHLGLISFGFELVWFICYPWESQESSPAPQFKSINYSAFNLLYGPTLTSMNDYWKNHSFNYSALVGKVMSLPSRFVIAFLPRSKRLNFMAAVTISSDFGAQENKICQFPLFPHLFAMK